MNSPITTHVLDTAKGKPAAGVPVKVFIQQQNEWQQLGEGVTNSDGRISDLLKDEQLQAAVYLVRFDVQAYAEQQGDTVFYPQVDIVFKLGVPEDHYHIPLLLSPYGYSTYRGS